jgi:hypothetical protein
MKMKKALSLFLAMLFMFVFSVHSNASITGLDQTETSIYTLNLTAKVDESTMQLVSLEYSGIEMQKNDTTIAGDQYGTDTCHVDNYGTISMEFKMEPKLTDWITRVISEGYQEGGVNDKYFRVSDDELDTIYSILGWHIESFNFPAFDSKSDSQLIQYVTIRIEKFTKA